MSVHHRKIRLFAIQTCSVKNNIPTPIMSELLVKRNLNYDLRSQTDFLLHSVSTVTYG